MRPMSEQTLTSALRLPPLGVDEMEAVSNLPADELFVDADFIPSSVAISLDALRVEELGVMQFRPVAVCVPGAALFQANAEQVDLTSSEALDDGWLMGAMALVATRPELLVHLFALTDHLDRGIVTLRLFKHGAWQAVTIDTMLPCTANGKVAFCSSVAGDELWPALLTKAMAKLYGSYAALHGGEVLDALVDLTAGHVQTEPFPVADHPYEEGPADAAAEDARVLDTLWKMLARNQKRGHLQGALTSTAESSVLQPNMLYPLLSVREPVLGLRLICVRDPYLDPRSSSEPFAHPWAPGSDEWSDYPEVAEELLPLSDGIGAFWVPLEEFAKLFSRLVSVVIAGHTTEAVVCEGSWRDGCAGGPRQGAAWCINPQYWVTLSSPATVSFELSQRDVRVPHLRPASSSATSAVAAPPENAAAGGHALPSYEPVSLCVVKGGPPSTMDYGRVWHGDDRCLAGEATPARRRQIGLSIPLSADRAYCIVPNCAVDVSMAYVLRIQADVPFTLKQAQPACVQRLHGHIEVSTAGGPRSCKTWTMNPQHWLTIRPPPTGAALARVRVHVVSSLNRGAESEVSPAQPSGEGGRKKRGSVVQEVRPADIGFTIFKGEFNRERFGKQPRPSSASASAIGGSSPPPSRPTSRPGTAPPGRPGSPGRQGSPGRNGSPPRGGSARRAGPRPTSPLRNGRPSSSRERGGADGAGGDLLRVGGHEQIVEFIGLDRNNDGAITQTELETFRKSKGGGAGLGASSVRTELPTLAEAGPTSPRAAERPAATGSPTDLAPPIPFTNHQPVAELLPAAGPSPLADGSTLDLAPVGSYMLAQGLPVRDTSDSRPTRRHAPDPRELVGAVTAESSEASAVLKIDPGLPYLLSVHTAKPGEVCDYSVSIYTDAISTLSLIESHTQRVLRGGWKSSSAGGSHIEGGRWTHNPQYALTLSAPAEVEISLERPANRWDRLLKMHTMSALMGLYVLRGESHAPMRSPSAALANIVHQSTFMPGHEVKATVYLEPQPDGAPYILMPATLRDAAVRD